MTKILVIEDEAAIRANLLEILELDEFEAIGAENGQIGIELARRDRPDLIICDIMMPEIDGYAVLSALRDDPETATIPFIFLTARTERVAIRQAMELGADDYLTKPCMPQELLRAVTSRLEKHALLKRRYKDEIKKAEDKLNHALYYDTLTHLPNRLLLREHFQKTLNFAQVSHDSQQPPSIPILCLGLDRFNRINDTLGHTYGDLLLSAVAERLKNAVNSCDTLARLSADQFVIILSRPENREGINRIVQTFLDLFSQPFLLPLQEIFLTASIGIVIYGQDGTDLDLLIQLAFRAMTSAKQQGGNQYQFYSQSLKLDSVEQLALETSLRYAIERQELEVYYQPQVDLKTGRIVGAEALIRWNHPQRGMISPAKFIPIAEETGLIVPIGEWVLQSACKQVKIWQQLGYNHLRIAVNLSARQFSQFNLCQRLGSILASSNFNPKYLELELTESIIVQNPDIALQILNNLRNMGIRIALDDFGTGYSSLGYLQRFPFDILKIDRCFIQKITVDDKNKALTVAIIEMAHNLNFRVIAEGVETVGEIACLVQYNCDEIQGYFFSPPVNATAFQQMLIEGRTLQVITRN